MKRVLCRKRKGFTLAELLIVVAIIAILVAIMVPVFGSSRANAIQERDAANIRSAYSEAVANAMATDDYNDDGTLKVNLDNYVKDGKVEVDSSTYVWHDTANHKIVIDTSGTTIDPDEIKVDSDISLTFDAIHERK